MKDPNSIAEEPEQEDVRERIIVATAGLIASGGHEAATTRAIAAAAAVQAPTIYRIFGDKRGLLDEVAERGLAAYIAAKSACEPHADPVQDLRDGWDLHIAFGLANPGLFVILSGVPRQRIASPAFAAGLDVLHRRVKNIALAGRLRISEKRAVALLQSMGVGTVLTLLSQPEHQRDLELSETAREAVVAAITGETVSHADAGARGPAAALRATLNGTSVLTDGERHLLEELLDRVANGDDAPIR